MIAGPRSCAQFMVLTLLHVHTQLEHQGLFNIPVRVRSLPSQAAAGEMFVYFWYTVVLVQIETKRYIEGGTNKNNWSKSIPHNYAPCLIVRWIFSIVAPIWTKWACMISVTTTCPKPQLLHLQGQQPYWWYRFTNCQFPLGHSTLKCIAYCACLFTEA